MFFLTVLSTSSIFQRNSMLLHSSLRIFFVVSTD